MDINELVLVPTTEQWSIASQFFFTKGAFCLFWLEFKRKIPPMDYLPFRWTTGILRIKACI